MDPAQMFEHLLGVLELLGVRVRREPFDPKLFGNSSAKGGLCKLQKETLVLVDASSPLVDQVGVLACALAHLPTENVFLHPAARRLVASHRRSAPKPASRRVALYVVPSGNTQEDLDDSE